MTGSQTSGDAFVAAMAEETGATEPWARFNVAIASSMLREAAALTTQDDQPIRLAYRLRAVTAGDFAHPAATVADMYRPERRGWTDSGRTLVTP